MPWICRIDKELRLEWREDVILIFGRFSLKKPAYYTREVGKIGTRPRFCFVL